MKLLEKLHFLPLTTTIICTIGAGIVLGRQVDAAPQSGSENKTKRLKTIDFHTTQSVGQLSAGHFDLTMDWVATTNLGPAVGRVQVPEAAKIMLYVNFYGGSNLAFLDHLGANDLTALSFSNDGSGYEIADQEFSRLGHLTGLEYLSIESSEAANKAMEAVSHMGKLGHLNLSNTLIKDDSMSVLPKLTKLQFLTINHNELSDVTLSYLQNLTFIRCIEAKRCGFTQAGMKYFTKLINLQQLKLSSNKIGDAGVRALPALPRLYLLDLGDCGITPACLPSLQNYPLLADLYINWCAPTKEAFNALCKLKQLEETTISGKTCNVGDIAVLIKAPKLRKLTLTVLPALQERARKMLPGVKVEFRNDKSGVPMEIFAPLH
jgi:Leucine-rich repeat (LRR) protein